MQKVNEGRTQIFGDADLVRVWTFRGDYLFYKLLFNQHEKQFFFIIVVNAGTQKV